MANNVLSKFVQSLKNVSAKNDKRVEVFYVALKGGNEAHITISLKPSEEGKYYVVRNGELKNVTHASIVPTDKLAVKVAIDMYGLSLKTIHRFDGASEIVKASSSFECAIALDSENLDIVALTRNEDKELQLSGMLKLRGSSFTHITESELTKFANERIGKFVNKIVNNTEAESRKREWKNREMTEPTVYGMFKTQQSLKRANKALTAVNPSAVVTTEVLTPATI
jgi:hypothetical protein